MKILTKYLYKEFLKFLFLCQIIFLTIYLIIDFLQKIDNFIEAEVSQEIIFSYFLASYPVKTT